ncbi:DUF397 domain-containing protein [Streptomyces sp. NPDC002623]|uniref:DUF397 domain-containing protein n=1 Tax=unclassified Streptomyces TaxID=2593676 RepID=UPI0033316CA3
MAEQPQPEWFKSTYSGSPTNECVECAAQPHAVLVRDSKNPQRATLTFPRAAWVTFTSALRLDDLAEL